MYGSKRRYDRPIEMTKLAYDDNIEVISADLLARALDDLKDRCEEDYLKNASHQLINEETCIKIDEYTSVSANYDKHGNITRYSIGCPSDNEYCGFTYQIIRL